MNKNIYYKCYEISNNFFFGREISCFRCDQNSGNNFNIVTTKKELPKIYLSKDYDEWKSILDKNDTPIETEKKILENIFDAKINTIIVNDYAW